MTSIHRGCVASELAEYIKPTAVLYLLARDPVRPGPPLAVIRSDASILPAMLNISGVELENLKRATFLAKVDLVTQMVTEMTSLQGIIGREYALRSGENAEVSTAIGEQYQAVPQSKIGVGLALTDRIDFLFNPFQQADNLLFVEFVIGSRGQQPGVRAPARAGD